MSLRLKAVLPLVGLTAILAYAFSSFILASHERDIATFAQRQLTSTLNILLAEEGTRESRSAGTPHVFSTDPLYVLAWYDADSSLIGEKGRESSIVLDDIPSTMRTIPGPFSFRHSSFIAVTTAVIPGDSLPPVARYAALFVATRSFQKIYEDLLFRLILFSIAAIAIIGLTGGYLSGWITRRINALRDNVTGKGKGGENDQTRQPRDALGQLATEILHAQQRIEQSRKEIERLQVVRSQFMANISHEVRTPLFSLNGYLDTLLEGGLEDPKVNRTFLVKALHQARRIDTLLRDLIEIARIESGDMKMSFRYFKLSSLLDQVVQDHADRARSKQQELRVSEFDHDLEVVGDKDRLRQALSNLTENALKYSPQGATIVLSVEMEEHIAKITVSDSGPGIPSEHVPRIFERFYRIDPERSRELGGTGLGLAIVKHIVEAHGSRIQVSSEVGQGTAFSFTLKT